MRVVLTGSTGRIGRAIFGALAPDHEVIGIDRNVFATTRIVGDFTDPEVLKPALEGANAVIHTAGPHAPHVGVLPDAEFERVNVEGTATLFELAREAGVERFVYTSTTALYGLAVEPGTCTWIDEDTEPQPRTIYHRTNLAAERLLEDKASTALPVRVLRMSRCFPEPAPIMTAYRLHRGIDARDVASGHARALIDEGEPFGRFILSGATPFLRSDCDALAKNADAVIRERVPGLAAEFDARRWQLPHYIDRIYSSSRAHSALSWQPRWHWGEVLAQLDRSSIEVLPPGAGIDTRAE
ncbi:NAD(P)-dependent oxidoreductase [Erythrobacter sp. THAF29]|uniref:NAD-dependent epimerase/dehydratase family protein n=1 Tax=Erythrobacter sp. THAF29 TaxID=2587851 RepID=UPI00126790BE|nr:NAD(P)-dependent oxidoreductase [Erythrobacter sp. THAF29]QFT78950.1 UDP-glucose 4-epimerase [Erythrobacter sp. THAF29]